LKNILDFVFDTKYVYYNVDNIYVNEGPNIYFIMEDKLKCYNPLDNFNDYITHNIYFKSKFLNNENVKNELTSISFKRNNENEKYLNKIIELKNKIKIKII